MSPAVELSCAAESVHRGKGCPGQTLHITSDSLAAQNAYAAFETPDSNLKQRHQQNHLQG